MPPKKKSTAKQYRADRSFNELTEGDVVEMEDDHPYLQTGYMVPVKAETEAAQVDAEAVTGTSTTTVSESGASGANEGPAGAGAGAGAGGSS